MSAIRVRMYNVGFGDCFLLTFPDGRTLLVDCGFHSQGRGAFSGKEIAERVIADVTRADGVARIDVVVATHRHQDHVYAFNAPEWDQVEVGEVWTNWLEDRQNREALGLWKKKEAFAAALRAALPGLPLDADGREDVDFMLWNAGHGPPEPGFEAWSNQAALDRLHGGFGHRDRASPRFLPETRVFPEAFQTGALPGARIHVLGPPRDPELIAEIDPERDGETYRALALRAAAAGGAAQPTLAPFAEAWRWTGPSPDDFEPDEIERIESLARSVDPLFAAQVVDGMINSTSLVLVLEYGKARLVLPGDAEWGTWKRILADPGARALLRGSTFLKVGHHGSHNATPRTLVEEVLRPGTAGMISTLEGPGKYRSGIPLPALLEAFAERQMEMVRSDLPPPHLPERFTRSPDGRCVDLELTC